MVRYMDFKGIEWLYAQAIPLSATWFATAHLDGYTKSVTLLIAMLAGMFFAKKMFHDMRKSRREDIEHKNKTDEKVDK